MNGRKRYVTIANEENAQYVSRLKRKNDTHLIVVELPSVVKFWRLRPTWSFVPILIWVVISTWVVPLGSHCCSASVTFGGCVNFVTVITNSKRFLGLLRQYNSPSWAGTANAKATFTAVMLKFNTYFFYFNEPTEWTGAYQKRNIPFGLTKWIVFYKSGKTELPNRVPIQQRGVLQPSSRSSWVSPRHIFGYEPSIQLSP